MARTTQKIKDEEPRLDMSSLIDVSFLLLIYFLVTSTLDPKESDLGMTLPRPNGSASAPSVIDYMMIDVDSAGRIVVNEEVLNDDMSDRDIPKLVDRLSTYAESARLLADIPTVVISADDAAKGQRFIDVLNALAHDKVRIQNVTIAGFSE